MPKVESYKIPEVFDDTSVIERLTPKIDYAKASWAPGIYQLETTDLILGYNSEDSSDGPSNMQAKALANRTRYLLELFLRNHNSDGTHFFTKNDFDDNIVIPETKIHLTHNTNYLKTLIEDIQTDIETTIIQAEDIREGSDAGLSWAIQKLVPMTWDYTGDTFGIELFTSDVTLSHTRNYKVLEAHKLDDTINLDTKEGISNGDFYILSTDGGDKYKVIQVKETCPTTNPDIQPTDIRLMNNTGYVIEKGTAHPGHLGCTNVVTKSFGTETTGTKFAYLSNIIDDDFVNKSNIFVYIMHNTLNDSVIHTVKYSLASDNIWIPLPFCTTDRQEDGTSTDIFALPDNLNNFRILVEYSNMEIPATFYVIAVMTKSVYTHAEYTLRPSINGTSSTTTADSTRNITVVCSEYKSVYDMPLNRLDVQASLYSDFHTIDASKAIKSTDGSPVNICVITVPSTKNYFLRARYIDSEGTASQWSSAVMV